MIFFHVKFCNIPQNNVYDVSDIPFKRGLTYYRLLLQYNTMC